MKIKTFCNGHLIIAITITLLAIITMRSFLSALGPILVSFVPFFFALDQTAENDRIELPRDSFLLFILTSLELCLFGVLHLRTSSMNSGLSDFLLKTLILSIMGVAMATILITIFSPSNNKKEEQAHKEYKLPPYFLARLFL